MAWKSIGDILEHSQAQAMPVWEAILRDDCRENGYAREAGMEKMRAMWRAMTQAHAAYDENRRSASGLIGGDAAKMQAHEEQALSGPFAAQVMTAALRQSEHNACMGRIVAAPTAGSCGVLPAVLIPYARAHDADEDAIVEALYVAAGFGQVVASRAFIAGAQGGCQAEVGTASAMAAAALVHLRGGDGDMMAHAFAMAMKNLLGLVCDPVAGLVEVPCVKRNVIGALGALGAADMALSGIHSRIPADQVIDAMREVGIGMPEALRETGKGGLAATPTALGIRDQMQAQATIR